jgi:voltage-gated potassium channel
VVTFLDTMLRNTNRNLRIEDVTVPPTSPMVGRTLGDLNTHARSNCLLLATKAVAGDYVYNPPDKEAIEAGMVLIVMGDPKDVRTLQAVCSGLPAPAPAPGA